MRYTITASKLSEHRTVSAGDESRALDVIDDLCAHGYKLEGVHDEDGTQVDPTSLLAKIVDEKGLQGV